MFAEPPWPNKRDQFGRNKAADHPELPFSREEIERNRDKRSAYFQVREATQLELKELKEAHFEVGCELREKCRPEIDDYMGCCTDRLFSIYRCNEPAIIMRKCLKKVETREFVDARTNQILQQRKEDGRSLIRSDERALYNSCFLPDNAETVQERSGAKESRRRPGKKFQNPAPPCRNEIYPKENIKQERWARLDLDGDTV